MSGARIDLDRVRALAVKQTCVPGCTTAECERISLARDILDLLKMIANNDVHRFIDVVKDHCPPTIDERALDDLLTLALLNMEDE